MKGLDLPRLSDDIEGNYLVRFILLKYGMGTAN